MLWSQFSAKKLAFFSKTNVMITIFPKTGISLSKKRQYFRPIFRRKYLKNHNIGPSLVSGVPSHPPLTVGLVSKSVDLSKERTTR
jgi:hypothetical protein